MLAAAVAPLAAQYYRHCRGRQALLRYATTDLAVIVSLTANGFAERLNSLVEAGKRRARGYADNSHVS